MNKNKRILFSILTFIASVILFSIIWAIVDNDIFEDGWWWGALAMLVPAFLQYCFNITKKKLIWLAVLVDALSIGIIALVTPKVFRADRYAEYNEYYDYNNAATNNNRAVAGTYTFTDEQFQETFKMILKEDGSAIIETPQIIKNGGEPIYCSWTDVSNSGYVLIDFSDYKPVIKSWENRMYTTVQYNNLFLDLEEMFVYPTRDHFKSKNPAHRLKLEKD